MHGFRWAPRRTAQDRSASPLGGKMALHNCYIILLLASLSCTTAFNLRLPGGGAICFDGDTGVLRIRLGKNNLPLVPPLGTLPSIEILGSIQIRKTNNKGYGAFARLPLTDGAFLGFYEGEIILSRQELDKKYPNGEGMDYIMSIDGGVTFIDGREKALDRTTFTPAHLNHADRGQTECNCVRVLECQGVAFFTAREVTEGEELCFDYGADFWRGREQQKAK